MPVGPLSTSVYKGPSTKVIFCACPQSYQDARYGLNRRLHNRKKKGWRCTGCARVTED